MSNPGDYPYDPDIEPDYEIVKTDYEVLYSFEMEGMNDVEE